MKIKFYRILFLTLFILCLFHGVKAQKEIIINNNFTQQSLVGLVDIYSSNNLLNVDSFWQNKKDLPHLPSSNFLPGLGDKFYWIVLNIKNKSSEKQQLIFEISNPVIDSIFFYEVDKESKITLLGENGDEIPFFKRKIINETPAFAVDLYHKESKTYILMLRKRKTIKFPLVIFQKKIYEKRSRKKLFYHSLYFGAIIVIIISVFISSFFTHRKLLLSYALYSFSIGLFLFTDSGYAFEFIYPNSSGLNSALRVPLSMMIFLSFMLFTTQFLEIKKYKPILSKIILRFSVLWISIYIISLPFYWISPSLYHSFILYIVYIFNISGLLLLLTSAILIYKFNKPKIITYIVAIMMLIIGVFVFSIAQFGLVKTDIVVMHPFMLASIGELLVFSIAVFYDIRKVAIERNALIIKTAKQEKDILTAQIQGNELASSRISNELHDNIASSLALIKNKLLNKTYDKIVISQDIKRVYNEVRDISHRLSANLFFMLGCKTAIIDFLSEVSDNSQLSIKSSIFCGNGNNEIDKKMALQLYRIIQEAIQNCMKYAGKADVNIELIKRQNNIRLCIKDNGKGFDSKNQAMLNGAGISNIRMRVKALKGRFELSSAIGVGTTIVITISE